LCLDLETLKSANEDEADKMEEDHDRLNRELASVKTSLKLLREQNSGLQKEIDAKH
jgi:predicted  nucleic acid-binding Zn-ribbon protein